MDSSARDVKVRTVPDEADRQVDVVFMIRPGVLATIRSIEVTGVPIPQAGELLRTFKFHKGKRYDRSRLSARLDNLRKQFLKNGFLAAVAQVSESFDPATNTVALTLAIANYGKVKVAVEGFKIDKDQLRRLLPILKGEGINREILEEGLENLKEYLVNKGYSEADVQLGETSRSCRSPFLSLPNHSRPQIYGVLHTFFRGSCAYGRGNAVSP